MNRPRVALLGVGWIGLNRLRSIVEDDSVDVVGLADPSPDARAAAAGLVRDAALLPDLDGLLELEPDGVVVATPSGQHAAQCLRILDRGAAVFCQKPLGCDAAEVEAVVAAARRADRLLGVDFSYRHCAAIKALEGLVREGALGRIYAADLVFHNAYGPDKPWYRDRSLSGGGCVMDLGIHLVDLALWLLGDPEVVSVRSARWAKGRKLTEGGPPADEDHAVAEIELGGGAVARLTCSWWLPAGQDCRIAVDLWGTEGGASFHNVNGSFYDFAADRYVGTRTERLVEPGGDAWGGRAAVAWCRQLAEGGRFDPAADRFLRVAEVLDDLYGTTA